MISLLCAAPHTQEKLRFGRGPGTNAEPSGSTSWGLGCHEGPVGRIFFQPKYCNRDETVSCTDAPVTAPGRRCGQYGCGILQWLQSNPWRTSRRISPDKSPVESIGTKRINSRNVSHGGRNGACESCRRVAREFLEYS